MTLQRDKRPECFAQLKVVFPMGDDGFRNTPDSCLACLHKTECLREAIQGREGIQVREEHIDRAYHSGMIGFLERWSRKKAINRQKNRS